MELKMMELRPIYIESMCSTRHTTFNGIVEFSNPITYLDFYPFPKEDSLKIPEVLYNLQFKPGEIFDYYGKVDDLFNAIKYLKIYNIIYFKIYYIDENGHIETNFILDDIKKEIEMIGSRQRYKLYKAKFKEVGIEDPDHIAPIGNLSYRGVFLKENGIKRENNIPIPMVSFQTLEDRNTIDFGFYSKIFNENSIVLGRKIVQDELNIKMEPTRYFVSIK